MGFQNNDIMNQYECKQTLDVSTGTLNIHAGTSLNPTKEGLRVWLLKRLISEKPDQFKAGSKICSSSRQDSYITTRVGITISPSHNNVEVRKTLHLELETPVKERFLIYQIHRIPKEMEIGDASFPSLKWILGFPTCPLKGIGPGEDNRLGEISSLNFLITVLVLDSAIEDKWTWALEDLGGILGCLISK
ncbi:hypothetical protein Tco_0322823 [Tanacetum coccineum]